MKHRCYLDGRTLQPNVANLYDSKVVSVSAQRWKRNMGVTVCLPLFGPPGRELEEGSDVKGVQLRKLADELHERLHKAALVLEKLHAAGWSARVAMYDVILTRLGVETKTDA